MCSGQNRASQFGIRWTDRKIFRKAENTVERLARVTASGGGGGVVILFTNPLTAYVQGKSIMHCTVPTVQYVQYSTVCITNTCNLYLSLYLGMDHN